MTRILLLILALSGLLALGYAQAMPVGAAPDEAAHLQYVRVLAKEARLPALDLSRRRDATNDPNYESHQSPLYYVLAVPFFRLGGAMVGEAGAAQACRILSILIGLGGLALVWALAREVAPERPALWVAATGLAAFLPMRLAVCASVSNDALAETTSSLALLVMLRALRGPWTWREALFLGGALALALLSKQSAIVLLPPALAAIYLASRGLGQGRGERGEGRVGERESGRAAGGKAAATGSKSSPPRIGRQGGPKARRPSPNAEPPRGHPTPNTDPAEREATLRFISTGLIVATAVIVLSGWWFARNHVLYGDPLGQRAFNWYFSDTPRWVEFRDQGWSFARYLSQLVLPTTFATFWGAFGHLSPDHPELFMGHYRPGDLPGPVEGLLGLLWPAGKYPPRSWLYPVLELAVLVALAGGVRAYLRARKHVEEGGEPLNPRAAALGIVILHAVFVVAVFFNFNATYFQAQGRYLFPAIAALAMGLAAGWLEWGRKRELIVSWGIVAGAAALAVYGLAGVLWPAFGPAHAPTY